MGIVVAKNKVVRKRRDSFRSNRATFLSKRRSEQCPKSEQGSNHRVRINVLNLMKVPPPSSQNPSQNPIRPRSIVLDSRIGLLEIVHEIRRQQQKASPGRREESLVLFEPIKWESLPVGYKEGEYCGGEYHGNGKDSYNPEMPFQTQSNYKRLWYSEEPRTSITTSPELNGTLTMDDLQTIQADSKLKSWGWGGSGIHLSLKKQEMYRVIKGMGSTFAWSTILYDMALR